MVVRVQCVAEVVSDARRVLDHLTQYPSLCEMRMRVGRRPAEAEGHALDQFLEPGRRDLIPERGQQPLEQPNVGGDRLVQRRSGLRRRALVKRAQAFFDEMVRVAQAIQNASAILDVLAYLGVEEVPFDAEVLRNLDDDLARTGGKHVLMVGREEVQQVEIGHVPKLLRLRWIG